MALRQAQRECLRHGGSPARRRRRAVRTVALRDGAWSALVVFGATLGRHAAREDAITQVMSEGLASLAEPWTLRSSDGSEEVVCIQEASTHEVTLALGHYSMSGVPTLRLGVAEIASGEWSSARSSGAPSHPSGPATTAWESRCRSPLLSG